jgi:hypothetical protein
MLFCGPEFPLLARGCRRPQRNKVGSYPRYTDRDRGLIGAAAPDPKGKFWPREMQIDYDEGIVHPGVDPCAPHGFDARSQSCPSKHP